MHSAITRDVIDSASALSQVGDPSSGAVLLFLGVVRDHNDGVAVTGVEYEAYVEMAGPVLEQITREAAVRLGTDHIVVLHRIGELRVGEASVAIAVSSPHRAEAFEACRYVIEEIKLRLPVWKREHYDTGPAQWLGGANPPAERSHG